MKKKYFETRLSKLTLVFLTLVFSVVLVPSLVNALPLTTNLLSESFGTGSTSTNMPTGWSEGGNSGDDAELRASGSGNDTASPAAGRFAVAFGEDGYICRTVNTVGYNNINLSYYWRGDEDSNSSSDNAYVEFKATGTGVTCSNPSGWTNLADHDMRNDSSWSTNNVSNSGMNNGSFLLRFRTSTNSSDEHFRVDGISVTGTPIPVPVNGGWSEWSPASCPTTPGSPESQLVRTCTNPTPANGGSQCQGEATQTCAAVPIVDMCPNVNGIQATGPCADTQCESNDVWNTESQQCESPEPLTCDPEKNLIENGSFEAPAVTNTALWDVFPSVIGWNIGWINPADPTSSLELHRSVNGWLPVGSDQGEQYAELDGDWYGPSNPGQGGLTKIFQDIQTIAGKNYKLKFSFSPRPGTDATENVLGVLWGGAEVAGSPFSGSNATNQTAWTENTLSLSGDGSIKRLQFEGRGIENSMGTFLDNVSLTCQNEPEDLCTYYNEVIVSDETNMVGENPAQLTWTHGLWVSTTTSAKWIWSDATVQNPTEDEVKTFTKTFTLNGNPTSDALISIASDNTYKVFVNGNEIASTTNVANYTAFTDYVVPASALVYGSNTITIVVHNLALEGGTPETNPAGVIYALYVNTKNCPGDNPQEPNKLQVKIYKYLDGVQATAQSANNYEFPMHAVWSWPSSEQLQGSEGTGDYLLGLNGHGGSGSYEAFTSTMNAPAIYQTYERTSDIYTESNVLPIDSQCVEGKYRLKGYRWGDSPTEAQSATLSVAYPDFTNLTADKYVIVENETCPEVVEPLQCEQGYHEEENVCVLDEREDQQDPAPTVAQIPGGRRHDVSGLFGGGSVLGASTEDSLLCEPYLKEYIKFGGNNNPEEVKKLQIFLNQFFELNNPITGFYGPITFEMVKKFQAHQEAGTLTPWAVVGMPTEGPTGYVYKTTKRWINILKCPDMIATIPTPNLP